MLADMEPQTQQKGGIDRNVVFAVGPELPVLVAAS